MTHRRRWTAVLLVAVGLVAVSPQAHAIGQWKRYELELKTEVRYDQGNPYRDLQLIAYWSSTLQSADLSKPSGFGFWDGTRVENGKTFNIFKIRTALPQGSYYLWYKCAGRTAALDCGSDGALNRTATSGLTVQIGANDSPGNRLYANGFLQAPAGMRYLTFAGKTTDRFYWQGDTAWPAPAREGQAMLAARSSNPSLPAGSVSSTWQSYINDRVKSTKGFTVVQVAPAVSWESPKPNEPRKAGCGTTEADAEKSVQWGYSGLAFAAPSTFAFEQISTTSCLGAVPNNCSRWRPDYWREVDAMIDYANSKGIVVVMTGVADPSDRGHCRKSQSYPTKEDSVVFARNLAARLAGNHVVFSINFDDWPDAVLDYDGRWPGTVHDTTLLVGTELKRAVPRHLVTNHLAGSAPVSIYSRYQNQPWLSFQLYQSGHALNVGTSCPGSGTSWQSRQKCAVGRALDFTKTLRALTPTKPVVNGEGPYELPQRQDATPPDNRYGMRHAAYASLLTGAAGFTSGVHGEDPPKAPTNEASIVTWDRPLEVLQSEGVSKDIPRINRLLMTLYPGGTTSWGEFTRAEGILNDISPQSSGSEAPGERRIFAGTRSNNYVAYLPNSTKVSVGNGLRGFSCLKWSVQWRDPRGLAPQFNPCPARQALTQFSRPQPCGDLSESDKKGLCDWMMLLKRPGGTSAQAGLSGSYVASTLIEALLDGELVLEGGGDRLVSQLMSTDDEPLGPENEASPVEEAFYGNPEVVVEPFAGASWIVWEAEGASSGESTDIFARRTGSNGVPLGEAFRVNQQTLQRQYDPYVVADSTGNVTLVWASVAETDEPDKPKADIFARRFGGDGTPLSNEFPVNLSLEKNQDSPVAGADAGGNLVVGWLTKSREIRVRLFSFNGSPRSGEIAVNAPSPGLRQVELAEVVVDPLGSFVVRWNEYSTTDELLGWYSRAFDLNGLPLGAPVQEGL